MKKIFIGILFLFSSCSMLATELLEGKAIPKQWQGYYNVDFNPKDDFVPVEYQYYHISDTNIFVKTIIYKDGAGTPLNKGGVIYSVKKIVENTPTTFKAIVFNTTTSDSPDLLFLVTLKTNQAKSKKNSKDSFDFYTPTTYVSNTQELSKPYFFITHSKTPTNITLIPHPHAALLEPSDITDPRPFLEKISGLTPWNVSQTAVDNAGSLKFLLTTLGIKVGSKVYFVKNGIGTSNVIVTKGGEPQTHTFYGQIKHLWDNKKHYPLYYTAYEDIPSPTLPIEKYNNNPRYGVLWFPTKQNLAVLLKGVPIYLPVMFHRTQITKNGQKYWYEKLFSGVVRMMGATPSSVEWHHFEMYTIGELNTYYTIADRLVPINSSNK